MVKLVAAEPSPQSTVMVRGLAAPGSVKEPRAKECESPSSELWLAAAVTLGATFAIATTWTASEAVSLAPSESVTLMPRLVVFGPSGKLHWKDPPEAVVVGVPTSVPWRPQVG